MAKKEIVKDSSFELLDEKQKTNYVKDIIYSHPFDEALSIILKDEKKDLKRTKTIINCLDDSVIKDKIKSQVYVNDEDSIKLFGYSRIISVLSFYNKKVVLATLFKSFDKDLLKSVSIYEYKNHTSTSISDEIFKKYCEKYKDEAQKFLFPSDEEVLSLDDGICDYKKITKGKNRWILHITVLLLTLIILFIGFEIFKYSREMNNYDGLIFKGTYLDNIDLSKANVSDVENIIDEEKEKLENGNLIIKNANGEYKFSYKDIGIKINSSDVSIKIKKYNDNLNFFQKFMILRFKQTRRFHLKGYFTDESINNFIAQLKGKLNKSPVDDGLVVNDAHEVSYDKGQKGFEFDADTTKNEVVKALKIIKEESVVDAAGKVTENKVTHQNLSTIDTKISTYTTYFENYGGRGHNIELASSKLNGTVINPDATFSYNVAVGPYEVSTGYVVSSIYLNGAVSEGIGGGVCQLASTLYNAQLRAGLETVARTNHTFYPVYVPNGLDATVYSDTVDYKFKNQYKYPFYVASYVNGGAITVDLWSNKDALGGKTYEPYAYFYNNGYVAYLKEIQNGITIKEKYLGISFYKAHY